MSARKSDTERVLSVALHPSEPLMAFGCETNVVKVYDVHKYSYVRILPMHGMVLAVRFSPCGTFLATASSSEEHDLFRVVVWQITASEGSFRLEKRADDNLSYESMQNEGEGSARVLDSKQSFNVDLCQFFLHQGRVDTLEFVPARGARGGDCSLLVSGSHDQTIRLWQFDEGKTEVWRKHTGAVTCVRCSMDGNFLASCGAEDQAIYVWRLRDQLLSGATSQKSYSQVLEFRSPAPMHAISFFPAAKVWPNGTRRYLLACGSSKHFFVLKVHQTRVENGGALRAIDFVDKVGQFAAAPSEWKDTTDTPLKAPEAEPNALELQLDYAEMLVDEDGVPIGASPTSSTNYDSYIALKALDTSVHTASSEDGKKRFLVAVGGGSDGALRTWVLSEKTSDMKDMFGQREYLPYGPVKRHVVRNKRARRRGELDKSPDTSGRDARRRRRELERLDKQMRKLGKGFVRVGQHMTRGGQINGIALPNMGEAGLAKKFQNLKMLATDEYYAMSVSDDETARIFKYTVKDPHEVDIFPREREAAVKGGDEKAAAAGGGDAKADKSDKKRGFLSGLWGNKRTKAPQPKENPTFCLASGELSKETKKLDGVLVLQRSLTEHQTNLLYSLNEQARDMRKIKLQRAAAAAKASEFKFKLEDDRKDEDEAADDDDTPEDTDSKFNHFQNLAEPPRRRGAAASRPSRGDCAACAIM